MTDRITIEDVARVAKSLTPSLVKAGALERGESLRVVREEEDNFVILQVDDGDGELTSHHSALDMLGHGGRLSAGPREAYYILSHLAQVVHAWGREVQENVRLREELKEANR